VIVPTATPPKGPRKNPHKVRSALLNAAQTVVIEHGSSRLTLDEVAQRAGVTKGGLLHHFGNKRDLLHGLADDLLARFEARIEELIAHDPVHAGRFTRAYLRVSLTPVPEESAMAAALIGLSLVDNELGPRYRSWLQRKLTQYADSDDNEPCRLVRLAADGAWLAILVDPRERDKFAEIEAMLLAMIDQPALIAAPCRLAQPLLPGNNPGAAAIVPAEGSSHAG
jgi:AcrR family transcriptional regulator